MPKMRFCVALVCAFTVCSVITIYSLAVVDDMRRLYSRSELIGELGRQYLSQQEVSPPEDDDLYSKVRVFCWVMSNPEKIESKAVVVWNTWGKRCNKIVFMTSQPTDLVPAVVLPVLEGRSHLTAKSVQAFNYTYRHHLNDYDWFVKADDDTFIVVENLRYFLSKRTANDTSYYGYHFKVIVKQGYQSGGAGYALSRQGLRMLVENGFNENKCRLDNGAEDAEIGKCLQYAGVKTGDSRDFLGKERFHPFSASSHLQGILPPWVAQYAFHTLQKGVNCCSDVSISFHYVKPNDMYLLHFLIYRLRVHGLRRSSQVDLNAPPPPRGEIRMDIEPA